MLSFKGIQVAPGVTLVGRPSVPGSAADAMLARRTTALRSLADVVVIVDRRGRVVDLVSHPTGLVLFPEGREFWVAIDGTEQARASFAFGFEQLVEGILPVEVGVEQMPRKARIGGRLCAFDYAPVMVGEQVVQVVIRVDDLETGTDATERAAADAEFRRIVELLIANPEASRAFFAETRWFMEQLGGELERPVLLRYLHTLKGNVACFGFAGVADFIHGVEEHFVVGDDAVGLTLVAELRSLWGAQEATYGSLFGGSGNEDITLSRSEYEDMVMGLMAQQDYAELLGLAQRWAMAPISSTFARLALQAQRIGATLGIPVETKIDHASVRLPAQGLESLLASLVHLVRNALDHGLGAPEARIAAGKPAAGRLSFVARMTDDDVLLSVSDDGNGINWERVRAKAAQAGLPHETEDDLVAALLSDGFSTRDATTEISGRGVGTAAVRAAAVALGGELRVASETGVGCTFTVVLPRASLATLGLLS